MPDVFMSTITIFSRARMVTSLCSAPQLSSSRVLLGCRTLQRSLIYYSSSFLFHLVVCRDFYKYLNANVERRKKKKCFSFLLTRFLFRLVLWANPSAVTLAVCGGVPPPSLLLSVTQELLLMMSLQGPAWLA